MANTKKEIEYTALHSASVIKPNRLNIKSMIKVYQICTQKYKRINLVKNIIIGILTGILTKAAGLMVEDELYLIVLWIFGVTVAVVYVLGQIDSVVNFLMLGRSYK